MRIDSATTGNRSKRSSRLRRSRASNANSLRPTTSKVKLAIFSMLGPEGIHGLRVLDIYAGTGALGIEALQRGATSATFIEQNSLQCTNIKKTLEKHRLTTRGNIRKGKALNAVCSLKSEFDLVFADPPYELVEFEKLFERIHTKALLSKDAIAFLEHSKKTDLPDLLPGLKLSKQRLYGDTAISIYRSDSSTTTPRVKEVK